MYNVLFYFIFNYNGSIYPYSFGVVQKEQVCYRKQDICATKLRESSKLYLNDDLIRYISFILVIPRIGHMNWENTHNQSNIRSLPL